MRDSTVVGRETTEGPLFSKLKFESFGTRETADVEAGEMDLVTWGGWIWHGLGRRGARNRRGGVRGKGKEI
jgi:hypothetical protein